MHSMTFLIYNKIIWVFEDFQKYSTINWINKNDYMKNCIRLFYLTLFKFYYDAQ